VSASNAAERDRLHGYIAASKRVQRKLTLVVIGLAVVSGAALVVSRPVGGILLLGTAIVGGCGFWVTAAHIADWRLKLRTLDQNREPGAMKISRKRSR
jgi:hypothetical protein